MSQDKMTDTPRERMREEKLVHAEMRSSWGTDDMALRAWQLATEVRRLQALIDADDVVKETIRLQAWAKRAQVIEQKAREVRAARSGRHTLNIGHRSNVEVYSVPCKFMDDLGAELEKKP